MLFILLGFFFFSEMHVNAYSGVHLVDCSVLCIFFFSLFFDQQMGFFLYTEYILKLYLITLQKRCENPRLFMSLHSYALDHSYELQPGHAQSAPAAPSMKLGSQGPSVCS